MPPIPRGKQKVIELRDEVTEKVRATLGQIEQLSKDAVNAATAVKRESYFNQRQRPNPERLGEAAGDLARSALLIQAALGALVAYGECINDLNDLLQEGSTDGEDEREEQAREERPQGAPEEQGFEPDPTRTALDPPREEEGDDAAEERPSRRPRKAAGAAKRSTRRRSAR